MVGEKMNRHFGAGVVDDNGKMYLLGGINASTSQRLQMIDLDDLVAVNQDTMDILSNLPKKDWEAAAMMLNADILEMREQLTALSGQPTYANLKHRGKTMRANTLKSYDVLQLIMQWLEIKGYSETLAKLQKQTDMTYSFASINNVGGSDLEKILSFAKRKLKPGVSVWSDEVSTYYH